MSVSESKNIAKSLEKAATSVYVRAMQAMLRRRKLRELMVPLACDDGIFLTEDCHLGAVFEAPAMYGCDENVVARLEGAFTGEMPAGLVVQFSYLSYPEIESVIGTYDAARLQARINNHIPKVLDDMVKRTSELFRKGARQAPIPGFDCLVNNTRLIVSLKFPIAGPLYREEELLTVKEQVGQIVEGLRVAGLQLRQLDAKEYVQLMRRLLDMNATSIPTNFNENQQLKDQIAGPGDYLLTRGDRVIVNNNDIRVMSVKMRPEFTSLATMMHLVGDPNGGQSQFNVPFMITTSFLFPERIDAVSKIRANAQAINYQAFGPMLKWSSLLAYKKEGNDTLVQELDQGGVPVKVATSIMLFGKEGDDSILSKQMGMVRAHYASFDYQMAAEKFIALPVFLNNLPLFYSAETDLGVDRSDTMGLKHAVNMIPVLGDWRGTGIGGAMLFLSRRNLPVLFDLYDSSVSRNAVVFSESGGGKSFLLQQIIRDYLSLGQGTRVWVIDNGRSYYKLCKYIGGEFIELTNDSNICLNPFSDIQNLDEELDYLKGVVAVMINPEGLDAYCMSRIEEAIKATYGRMGNAMTITDIAEFLVNQSDQRLYDMGMMLFPFTRTGQYGRWFDGVCNLRLNFKFVVLELAELQSRQHLQKVVLFMLMDRVQKEMYGTGSNVKKLLLIDESFDLIQGNMGPMIASFYRKIRKEGGAAIIACQSLVTLYESAAGREIAANSPFKLVLSQNNDSITAMERDGMLGLDAYGYRCMRSLKMVRGKFSELLMVTPMGYGVVRLVVDRIAQVIYSSTDAERTVIMGRIQNGENPVDVVNEYIAKHG